MAANTEILIKRSLANNSPALLKQGELAFSYTSNTLFIGTSGSDDAFEIAGYRDYSGNFVSGPGQYGNATSIPVITVAANGQITAINTASISTTLNINADLGGPSTVDLLSQTLDVAGGEGLTSTVSGQTITLDVDDTVVRSNTASLIQIIDGDIQISGNLTVLGNTTSVNVSTLSVDDSLIALAKNNVTDIVDIGFYGHYNDGTARHAGMFRHAGDKLFYIFDGYDQEPTANTINPADPSFLLATVKTNITSDYSNVSTLLDVTGNAQITGTLKAGLSANTQTNIVYYDSVTKELTYGDSGVLTPHQIANGSYSMTISSVDGLVYAPQSKIVVNESMGTNGGGYSFYQDGNQDTGMFSDGDGELMFYANDDEIIRISGVNNKIQVNRPIYLDYGSVIKDSSGGAIAFGNGAGYDGNQGTHAIAIGADAGSTNQDISAVALGNGAGNSGQSFSAVAVGRWAGEQNQGWDAVAVGRIAGRYNQGAYSTAMGWHAGRYYQGTHSVAIGDEAGDTNQNNNAVAIGSQAGNNTQGWSAVAVGIRSGYQNQGPGAVALGSSAGRVSQGTSAVAIGRYAASSNQNSYAVAVGRYAGQDTQGSNAVAVGHQAGQYTQNQYAVAVGYQAGYGSQANYAVAIGPNAGQGSQAAYSVAVGSGAGYSGQLGEAIAIGVNAAMYNQGAYAVALGSNAGGSNQETGAVAIGRTTGVGAHQYSVAIGYEAGNGDSTALGDYAIAIGYRAGYDHGVSNSIVLNASGADLSASVAGLYINPVRYTATQDAVDDGLMFYNQTTKEVRYSYALDGGSF